MKYIVTQLLLFSLLIFNGLIAPESVCAQKTVDELIGWGSVLPSFPGGTKALDSYFANNFSIPDSVNIKSFSGTIYMKIIVRANGKVDKPEVAAGLHQYVDSVILKLVQNMPDWKPGYDNNDATDAIFVFPIHLSYIRPTKITTANGTINQKDDIVFTNKSLPALDPVIYSESELDKAPTFPLGKEELENYFKKNMIYPFDAINAKKEGTLFLKFVVFENGSVGQISALNKIFPSIDEEGLRLIKGMPKWYGGTKGGKPVKCSVTVPVVFRLKDLSAEAIKIARASAISADKSADEKNNSNPVTLLNPVLRFKKTLAYNFFSEKYETQLIVDESAPNDNTIQDNKIYTNLAELDQKPYITGGDKALDHFIKSSVIYPLDALMQGIETVVFVKFRIEKNGKVSNPSLVDSCPPVLLPAVNDVLKNMPSWNPGSINGNPVTTEVIYPVVFSISNLSESETKIAKMLNKKNIEITSWSKPRLQGKILDFQRYQNERLRSSDIQPSKVVFKLTISKHGDLKKILILNAKNDEIQRKAMIALSTGDLYLPGIVNGNPTEMDLLLTINIFQK